MSERDIVERLRGVRGGWTDTSCAAVEALCSEAAAEIELLRALVPTGHLPKRELTRAEREERRRDILEMLAKIPND